MMYIKSVILLVVVIALYAIYTILHEDEVQDTATLLTSKTFSSDSSESYIDHKDVYAIQKSGTQSSLPKQTETKDGHETLKPHHLYVRDDAVMKKDFQMHRKMRQRMLREKRFRTQLDAKKAYRKYINREKEETDD